MKKILYTATVASHICQFLLPYFKRFREMGYEVHVAAHDNLSEKNGLALRDVDKFFEVPFRRSPFSLKNLSAKRQLKRIIDEGEYDIIVCNTPVGGIVTRAAARRARRRGTKVYYI
ncbi:MAG: glycosyltransferase, partial [Clostridia bacterium]|nr:glycosyltransferase [Clostridia bacterium]